MIYKLPASTTYGSIVAMQTKHNIQALTRAMATAFSSLTLRPIGYDFSKDDLGVFGIISDTYVKDLHSFTLPVYIEPTPDRVGYVVSDLRNCAGEDFSATLGFKIRSRPEFTFRKVTAGLIGHWVLAERLQHTQAVRELSKLPMVMYASLITEVLAKRYNLEPAHTLKVRVVAAAFWQGLFTNHSPIATANINNTKVQLRVALGIHETVVSQALTAVQDLPFATIKDMVAAFKVACDNNVRLEDFDEAMLLQLLAGSWYTFDPATVIGVALEYPPVFLAMLYTSSVEDTFKNSRIADLMKSKFKPQDINHFVSRIDSQLQSYEGK